MSDSNAIDLPTISQSATTTLQPVGEAVASEPAELVKPKRKLTVSSEFLPPCRVCKATASGYHYGANTCEACKAFFCRSMNHKLVYKPCQLGNTCANNPKGKLACPDCRLRKCVQIGMTKEGVKRGRYTYSKRTEDTKEVNRIRADRNVCKSFDLQHCLTTSALLVAHFHQNFKLFIRCYTNKNEMDVKVRKLVPKRDNSFEFKIFPGFDADKNVMKMFETINQRLSALEAAASDQEAEAAMTATRTVLCTVWALQLEQMLGEIVGFTKLIPGFSDLEMSDRVLLLKQGRAETLHLYRHPAIYVDIECVVTGFFDTGDLVLTPWRALQLVTGPDFIDSMNITISGINKYSLNLEDTAVLIAFIMCTPDRVGLERSDKVERLQDSLLPVLEYTLKKNHPDNPNITTEILLFLPLLRENNVINGNALRKVLNHVSQEDCPLLFEMLLE